MSISTGYLTTKQLQIWSLKNQGTKEAHIARQLDVTRQTVHKIVDIANNRVEQSLKEVAELNKIDVTAINPQKGYLTGYSAHFRTEAIVTFSVANGVQVWFRHEDHCSNCTKLSSCRQKLLNEAKERQIPLADSANVLPSKLAEALFEKIMGDASIAE